MLYGTSKKSIKSRRGESFFFLSSILLPGTHVMAGASVSIWDHEDKDHPRIDRVESQKKTGLKVFLGLLCKAILDRISPGCFNMTEKYNSVLFTLLLLRVVLLYAMEIPVN